MKKTIPFLFAGIFLFCLFPVRLRADANSAQTSWYGRDSLGAYVLEGDCPIAVERERLIFDIHTYPRPHEYDPSLAYDASVTAEYTFCNPADLDVTARLAFPFGEKPDYFYGLFDDSEEFDDGRYSVRIDGEETAFSLRYTYCERFELETQLRRLTEESVFSAQTPVWVYSYYAPSVIFEDEEKYPVEIRARLSNVGDPRKTRILFSSWDGWGADEDGETVYIRPFDDGFTMTVIGAPLEKTPVFESYYLVNRGPAVESHSCGVEVKLLSEEETLFSDYVLPYYSEEEEIGFEDFLKAASDMLCEGEGEGMLFSDARLNRLGESLMRWFEYELRIPAGGKAENSVTAPLYPDFNLDYEPPIYQYTYLLSPASTWADFGKFEAEIRTDYKISESVLPFELSEGKYVYAQEGLPEGELVFTLSESETPKRKTHFWRSAGYIFAFIIAPAAVALALVCGLAGLIVLIVFLVKRSRKR